MSNDQKTVLILGVSSFLGSNLANFLKTGFKVIGTYHNHPVNIPGVFTFPSDIFNRDECQLIFHSFRPDFTIFCVGQSSLNECNENTELAELYNTNGLIYPTEFSHRYKSRIIYISTCEVFSGLKKEYREIDPSDSHTILGKTKSAGEFYLEKNSLDYLIFRCCQLYGRNLIPWRANFFEFLQRGLVSKKQVTCDQFLNYGHLDVNYLGMIIELAMKRNIRNHLLQVSSRDTGSFYQFAQNYSQVFGENEKLIKKGRWEYPTIRELDTSKDKARNFKMVVENLENYLDISMPSIEESLKYSLARFKGENKEKVQELTSGVSDEL